MFGMLLPDKNGSWNITILPELPNMRSPDGLLVRWYDGIAAEKFKEGFAEPVGRLALPVFAEAF